MPQLLVNTVNHGQAIIDIEETGSYFDKDRIVWDTRKDGELPKDIVLGKMARSGKELQAQEIFLPSHEEFIEKQIEREEKEKKTEELIDKDMTSLKELSVDGIEKWAESNLTTIEQLAEFNKKLIKLLIARGIL